MICKVRFTINRNRIEVRRLVLGLIIMNILRFLAKFRLLDIITVEPPCGELQFQFESLFS